MSIHDTIRGDLYDGGLSTFTSGLALNQAAVYNIFHTKTVNAAGIYSVRLYDMGVPITVTVDDYVPYDASYPDTAFWYMNTTTKSMWPHIL